MPAKTDINKMSAKGWAPIAFRKQLDDTWWALIKPIDEETQTSWYWELYVGEPHENTLRTTKGHFANPWQAADDLVDFLRLTLAQEGIE